MSQTQVQQADSIQEEDPHNELPTKKQKSRRPASKSEVLVVGDGVSKAYADRSSEQTPRSANRD